MMKTSSSGMMMAGLHWQLSAMMLMKIFIWMCWLGAGTTQTVKTLPFWLDSYMNCTGPVRLIYKNERAIIHGQGAIESRETPRDCRLILKTENNFEKTYFRIQIKRALIKECTVHFTIYDGKISQTPLDSFDCNRGKGRYNYINTRTDTAVFELKRKDLRDILYDIEMIVTPHVVSGELGWENDFGRDEGIYPEKFPTEAILGIVGAALGVVVIIIITVSVMCYRKHKAKHSNSEEYKVGFANTGISFEPKGTLSDISAASWSTDMRSVKPRDPHMTRMARPSEDVDSVFDNDTMYKKRPIAMDSLQKLADTSRGQRRGFDRRVHNALRNRETSFDRTRDESFNSYEEEHSPKPFIEKVLTPRVKTTQRKWDVEEEYNTQDHAAVDDEELDDEQYSSDEEAEEKDTEEDDLTEKNMEESEEEEEEEEEENEMPPDYRNATQDIPSIHHTIPVHSEQVQPPVQFVPSNEHQQRNFMTPQQPQYIPLHEPQPGHVRPQQPQYAPQYMMYPGTTGPNQFAAAPSGYNQFLPTIPDSMPHQAGGEKAAVTMPTVPPIYSYLAERGCLPLDGRDSPVSVATQGRRGSNHQVLQTDEPDQTAMPQLGSGVELMRR